MNNYLRTILKVSIIYIFGYLLSYPILFILFFTFKSRFFFIVLCVILAVCGFFSWILIHHKRAAFQKLNFRKIRREVYREYRMQLVGVVILLVMAFVIDIFDLYRYGMKYFHFMNLFFDEEMAFRLSVSAIPDPGVLYFIAASFFYFFYNIARFLFDRNLYFNTANELNNN